MGTHVIYKCQQCGSVELDVQGEHYTCLRKGCGHEGPTSKAGRHIGSFACDFEPPSQSVPRPKKGKRRWKKDE